MSALHATRVSKLFGQVRALDEVELSVGTGVVGLLGPNGSGKSTLFKLFAGQLLPDTGQVRLFGQDPFRSPHALKDLGLCPEQDKFYEDCSPEEFVRELLKLNGYKSYDAGCLARYALERVGATEFSHRPIKDLSRGMRQRVKIAQAIAHDPAVVLLDEPLTGADPVARADLIALVRTLGREGRSVLVSSHVLHEVEAMTHQVVFIRFGRLRAEGDVLRLRAALEDRPYRVRVEVPHLRAFAAHLLTLPHIKAVEIREKDVELTTVDLEKAAVEIPALASKLGLVIERFTSPDADLESLYRYLMAHA